MYRPMDHSRSPAQRAKDFAEILELVCNPMVNETAENFQFKHIDQLLPKKPGQTPEERANDIDNTFTWLRNRGVDGPNIIPTFDFRSPEQKDEDLKTITNWFHNPQENESAHTLSFTYIAQLLPPKAGQTHEERAQDIDNALLWVHKRGLDGPIQLTVNIEHSERERQVDPEYIANAQFTPAQENEVLLALTKHPPTWLTLSGQRRCTQIAAQFKLTTSLFSSALTPTEIEAILTQIIEKQEKNILPDKLVVKISFSDNDDLYDKGVRVFTFEEVDSPKDIRSPEEKARDFSEILNVVRNPMVDATVENFQFKRVDQELLPKKPGQTPEERANDIDNTILWLRLRGIDEPGISIPDSRTPQEKAKDLEGITKWFRSPLKHASPDTLPFKYIDQLMPRKPQTPEDRAQDIDSALRWVRNRGFELNKVLGVVEPD